MNKLFILITLFIVCSSLVLAVSPFGASNVTQINTSRATADGPQSQNAVAGNVTEINVVGSTITQSWQGYYGNITGVITLGDVNNKTMYNWSLASPKGELYVSTNNSINWQYIQCLNYTSQGTYASDTANAGATSQFGTNITQLEGSFNITPTDVDGVNETFTLSGVGTHNLFYANNLQFSEGECMNTRLYSSLGIGENDKFEEALLYEPTTRSIVFTSILNQDLLGFDNRAHDFETLVLENGHGTDTATTTYYFYVELQ